MAERFNQSLQNKVRSYIYDSKLPENLWDLAMYAAVYAYNRTPHKSNNMITPLESFAPHHKIDISQIKRFGCVAYIKVQRKTGPKFRSEARRVILVGYTPTGFQFLKPEEGKYYESRNARFNERLVYGDIYGKNSIKNHQIDSGEIDKENWFVKLDTEEKVCENNLKPEGEDKRRRGRPKKGVESNKEGEQISNLKIIDNSFESLDLMNK